MPRRDPALHLASGQPKEAPCTRSAAQTSPTIVALSHLDDHALTPDAVKNTSVVHRHILLCDNLDDLLRHHTTC